MTWNLPWFISENLDTKTYLLIYQYQVIPEFYHNWNRLQYSALHSGVSSTVKLPLASSFLAFTVSRFGKNCCLRCAHPHHLWRRSQRSHLQMRQLSLKQSKVPTGSSHFSALCFTALHWYGVGFLLLLLRVLQIDGLWQPCVEQVDQHHFSNSIFSLCICVTFP